MLNSTIRNGLGNKVSAEVTDEHALKVATIEYKDLDTAISTFVNPTYGSNMAVNASPIGGSPINVHNGEENTYWSASSIAGIWDFASEAYGHDSTASIDGTLTIDDDIAQFTKGSVLNLGSYSAITGWVYIISWPSTGVKQINLTGWDTGTSLQVGIQANIGNYVNITELNTWQKFIIPLSDMNLYGDAIDALRLTTIDDGVGDPINFYLDDIILEGGGASVQEYTIFPDIGEKYYVTTINLFVVDDYDSTLLNGTMPKLSYDKLLGETFLTGFIFRVIIDNIITYSFTVRHISDIMSFPLMEDFHTFSDGVNTGLHFSFGFPVPVQIDSRSEDRLSILITEDFSGLVKMTVTAASKLENI
ncbi:MAG: hypothetical protein KGD64_08245 [Candidatus Heimdallarchaeota archaeon]|nr:hypothetical protein [Candidatus Heimdallarchaeota archaeon]